jgi:hypothetical protein
MALHAMHAAATALNEMPFEFGFPLRDYHQKTARTLDRGYDAAMGSDLREICAA